MTGRAAVEWFLCEPRSDERHVVAAVVVLVMPLLIRLVGRSFRNDLLGWITWDDPFGLRFYRRNIGFLLAWFALFIGFCLLLENSEAYCP